MCPECAGGVNLGNVQNQLVAGFILTTDYWLLAVPMCPKCLKIIKKDVVRIKKIFALDNLESYIYMNILIAAWIFMYSLCDRKADYQQYSILFSGNVKEVRRDG